MKLFWLCLALINLFVPAGFALKNYETSSLYTGQYELPSLPGQNNPFRWSISSVKWTINKDFVRVSYDMPEDLMNSKFQTIVLQGELKSPSGFIHLKGSGVTARCLSLQEGEGFICLMVFNKDPMNQQVPSFFEKHYKDQKEKQDRIKLAQAFGAEPIGILYLFKVH